MNNNTDTKECTLCKTSFLLSTEYFGKDKKSRDGLSSRCKGCLKKLREDKKEIKRQYDRERRENLGQEWIEQSKRYYQNNKEKKRKYDKAYREINKDKRTQQKREYYLENRNVILHKNKQHTKDNEEHYIKYRMEYYNRNKELLKEKAKTWRINNRDKFNVLSQRRRARKKKVASCYTESEWISCKRYFDEQCAYCGSREELTQEHFIPLAKGGEYTINNIIPACRSCNCSKQDKEFEFWYRLMPFYSKERKNKIYRYLGYNENTQQLALFE